MARPSKQSLDYFPLDCDFFDDDKIALTADEFGIAGELVAIKILCRIYSTGGYYCDWNRDACSLFSRRALCGSLDADTVWQIVEALIRRGFFSKDAFDQHGILTSRGIVKRFSACHKYHPVFQDEHKETLIHLGIIEAPRVISDKTENELKKPEVISEETPQRKEKKSKVKQTKVLEQTNKQTNSEVSQEVSGSPDDHEQTSSVAESQSPQNAIRSEVVRILVKPNEYNFDRQLVDLATNALITRAAGITTDSLKQIALKADHAVRDYENTQGRTGKKYRWQFVADELHNRFRSQGLPFPQTFSGVTEPPPEVPYYEQAPPRNKYTPQTDEEESAEELEHARQALLSQTDPTGETLAQTQQRLRCDAATAFKERANWKIVKKRNLAGIGNTK